MARIAHISDPHYPIAPHLSWRDTGVKRILGYLSWHRKRKHLHLPDILDKLSDDLKAQNIDHIVIGGDLVNLSLDQEYQKAAQWVATLGAPDKVSLVPGNHDAYRRDLTLALRKYMGAYANDGEYPFVRTIKDIDLIHLSTAIHTKPFMAIGKIDKAQFTKLEHILKQSGNRKHIIVLHHPPQKNACQPRKSLINASHFREILSQHNPALILHGHLHHSVKSEIRGKHDMIPVRGCGSCSTKTAHYHVIEIINNILNIEHRTYDEKTGLFKSSEYETLKIKGK